MEQDKLSLKKSSKSEIEIEKRNSGMSLEFLKKNKASMDLADSPYQSPKGSPSTSVKFKFHNIDSPTHPENPLLSNKTA